MQNASVEVTKNGKIEQVFAIGIYKVRGCGGTTMMITHPCRIFREVIMIKQNRASF